MHSHLSYLLDTPQLTIARDHVNDWLYVDWKGEHTSASSRQGCELMLEYLRKYPCSKVLNDSSNVTQSDFKVAEWIMPWLKMMHQTGMQALAWVYPPLYTARQSTDEKIQFVQGPMLATFDDVASACEWLQSLMPHRLENSGPFFSEPVVSYQIRRAIG